MAGGPSTPELAAAVSNAGGLGSVGGGYRSPAALRDDIRAARARTERPFALNLFVPGPFEIDPAAMACAVAALAPYRAELDLAPQDPPDRFAEDFDEQLAVVLAEAVPIVTFTFGVASEDAVARLHGAGALVGGTATTVPEALAFEAVGADFVIAQGAEAGGHRAASCRRRATT